MTGQAAMSAVPAPGRPAIRITVLGSSGSYAGPANPCTGYLVSTEGAHVLLDCGPGTLGPLQRAVDLADLSAVVLTHCHPDHWLELPVLRNVFRYFRPRSEVPLYGTAETKAMDDALSGSAHVTADSADPRAGAADDKATENAPAAEAADRDRDPGSNSARRRHEPFDWHVIDEGARITIGDQRWSFSRTDHPVETLAARVDSAGRSAAYTSDTGPAWGVAALGHGIDLVLHDASHLQDLEGRGIPHCSAREAGERAAAAGVKRLVVTHLVPGSDPAAHCAEAAAAYGKPTDVALPGDVFAL